MPMTRKNQIFILAVFGLMLINWWLDLAFKPARPSDVYGFWSRLIPLVVGCVAFVMWVGVLVADSRRGGGPQQPPPGSG